MSNKPPLMDLPIKTAEGGFYDGFSKDVTITAKILIGGLIIWAVGFPDSAGTVLNGLNSFLPSNFATWYIWVVEFFVLACVVLAINPASGRLKMGLPDDEPEVSNFS